MKSEIQWISPEIWWISWNTPVFHEIQQDFTKATEFHRISWNQQDLTQFHKIQHNFTKTNRIYWNPGISMDFVKSHSILLKATEFYRISLNSKRFHCRFYCRFYYNVIYGFHCMKSTWNLQDVMKCVKWNLKSSGFHLKFSRFHEIHQFFINPTGFYEKQQNFTGFHEINKI